ncbi:hypothetical protein EX895_002535 [Sporisorium graminicola]|uniref:Eukaryotic translation initiation factor 4E binding protein n=1 Tax=Sporisorium graminicola TaxID=280036 RepID=A0A4U7KWF0_9BASI|nr:hypothetical protein EX895_002535 [Sporisorium graminicola]TKY88546.1 hypothetical protein EX895_002535 [Sporisorium graminicola]
MSSTIPIATTITTGTAAASSHTAANGSSTSVYGTTPGGTPRISYSRDQLLNLASSPLSRSPPNFDLPAAISRTPKLEGNKFEVPANANVIEEADEEREDDDEATAFAMDL